MTIRRAPVDDVEANLTAIGIKILAVCNEIASLPLEQRDPVQAKLNGLIERQTHLRIERDDIISTYFYGTRRK